MTSRTEHLATVIEDEVYCVLHREWGSRVTPGDTGGDSDTCSVCAEFLLEPEDMPVASHRFVENDWFCKGGEAELRPQTLTASFTCTGCDQTLTLT